MSSLIQIVRRLAASFFATHTPEADPDTMALRDWADLPSHHPLR